MRKSVYYHIGHIQEGDSLEVLFSDKKLQKICSDEKLLQREYGQNARKIQRRLFELHSVDNLSQISPLPPPRRHQLKGDRKGQYAVDVKHPFRIVFVPANDPVPLKDDGGVDLEKVTVVEIVWIGDYHGE